MAKVYDLLIKARGETKDAERAMKQLQRNVHDAGKKMQRSGMQLSAAITAPIIGLGVMGAREMGDIEKANKQTDRSIQRVGLGAKVSTKFVQMLAGELQNKSGIDDQAIQSGENLLLTLGSIDLKTKRGVDTFKVASRSMVEFADTMGIDVTTAGKMYAKTLSAASQGAITLPKGVKLGAKAMDDLTAAMKRTKDPAERQTLVLDALQKKFKGGMDLTNSDKWAVTMDHLAGSAAKLVTMLLPAFDQVVAKVGSVTSWFESLNQHGQKLVGVGLLIAAALGPILIIAGTLTTALAAIIPVLAGISLPVIGVVAAIAALGVALVVAYRKSETFRNVVNGAFRGVSSGVKQVLTSLKSAISVWISWGTQIWAKWGGRISGIVGPIFSNIATVISLSLANIRDGLRIVLALLTGDWSGAWTLMKGVATRSWAALKSVVSNGVKAVGRTVALLGDIIGALESSIWGKAKSIGKSIIDGIVSGIKAAPGAVADALGGVVDGAVKAAKKKLHINSPSKLFAREVGEPMSEGIAVGIATGGPGIARSLTRVVMYAGRAGANAATHAATSPPPPSGIDSLGHMFGANVTAGQVMGYATASTSQPYSVTTDKDTGRQSVATNTIAKDLVAARLAANKARIGVLLAQRSKTMGALVKARAGLKAAQAALGRAKKGGKKATIATAAKKVSAATDAVGTLEGQMSYYESEILQLGGDVQNDEASLEPPDVDNSGIDKSDADKAASDAHDAENLRRTALNLPSIEEQSQLEAINAIRAANGLAPVSSISEIGATGSSAGGSSPLNGVSIGGVFGGSIGNGVAYTTGTLGNQVNITQVFSGEPSMGAAAASASWSFAPLMAAAPTGAA